MSNPDPLGECYDEPLDHYDEYMDWLMANVEMICNGDDLVRHFEAATRFDEFLSERKERGRNNAGI